MQNINIVIPKLFFQKILFNDEFHKVHFQIKISNNYFTTIYMK
jgi:hypothetical protein